LNAGSWQHVPQGCSMNHANYRALWNSAVGTNAGSWTPVCVGPPQTEQFTPDQADWSTFELIFADNQLSHDPNDVLWISQSRWEEARWDGTVYNPSQMSKSEFHRAICPGTGSGDTVRGIREVFHENNPFADIRNPTKAEVDNWHRIALNHIRALVGYTGPEYQAVPDHCLFARALWANQRQRTTDWDAAYPTGSNCNGPCTSHLQCAGHCGTNFLPNPEDQAPFLEREGAPESCTRESSSTGQGQSEGSFTSSISRVPWSIKWGRPFCHLLRHEGFWGGHTGPWFHRQKFGWSFWDIEPTNSQSNAQLRAKWSGNSLPNLYPEP